MPRFIPWRDIAFALFIFAIAFFIRSYDLGRLPLNHDEANVARNLLAFPERMWVFIGIPLIFFLPIAGHSVNFLLSYLSGARMFSLDEFILFLRLRPVLLGTFSVLGVYVLAREMYGRLTAVIASLFLCFLPWHIAQSRMAGLVSYVPLLGCLIFWGLLRLMHAKKTRWIAVWFAFVSLFLMDILYTYNSAIIFIPIFLVSLLWLSKDLEKRMRIGLFLVAAVSIYFCLFPKFGKWELFFRDFYRGYHENIFQGNLFLNLWENIRANFAVSLKRLFFDSNGSAMFTARALRGPLLIHSAVFFLLSASLIQSLRKREIADKILLVWLGLGFLGVLGGVNFFEARYALILLPPLVIFSGKAIAALWDAMVQSRTSKRFFLLVLLAGLVSGIVLTEIVQWARYYCEAPLDFNECRNNSYGSQEVARFLSQIPGIEKNTIFMDNRMTVDVYLYFYLRDKGMRKRFSDFRRAVFQPQNWDNAFYVFWAPESHRDHSALGWAPSGMFDRFKQIHNGEVPMKKVYYPNGLPALYLYHADLPSY